MFSPESFIIRRQCTPFCEAKCKYAGQHHKILVAVINCVDARGYNEFTKTITKSTKKGWNIDDPIKDPVPEYRYPLVHWATVLGNVMVLQWCIEQGLNLNKRWGQRSETALHRLMVCGYSALREKSENILKTFKKLVKRLKLLLHLKDDNKDLPIHVAAKVLVERPLLNDSRFERTYTEMLKILIQITCEMDLDLLNCRNIEGNTVMHILAQHDKGAEILELLVENGADCDLPNSEGLKPIDIARGKDATDIIAVLVKNEEELNSSCFKNEDDLGAEEIGDIDVIYIESDEDMDNNNDEKDEIYIRNLLERVKSESDNLEEDNSTVDDGRDTYDPDWNVTELDASSSNETLLTIDEESYDIDGPFAALHDAGSTLRRNDFAESLSTWEKDNTQCSIPQTPDLKRKSYETETVVELETKKLKTSDVQGKENKALSPKLEIQLNMPKFKSLKRKIREESSQGEKAAKTVFPLSSSPDLQTAEINAQFTSSDEVFVSECSKTQKEACLTTETANHTVEKASEQSNQEKEMSPSLTLPGMCSDNTEQVPNQLMNYLSNIKEPLTAKTAQNISDKEEQRSFSSSAEIRSAWQRLHGKLTGRGSVKVNRDQLSKLFDILKPVGAGRESPVATSTPSNLQRSSSPNLVRTEQDSSTSGGLPTTQQLSSSSLQTVEQHRSSPGPVLSKQHSNQCNTSIPAEQYRSKKKIEDVISNLRERQRRESFESSSSTESVSIQEETNSKESNVTEQQTTPNVSAKNDTSSREGFKNTVEKQVTVEDQSKQKQLSSSSSPVGGNDEMNRERVPSQGSKQPHDPNSNIVIKKEVEDSEYGEKLLDCNTTTEPTTATSSVRLQSREEETSNQTAVSTTKQLNKRPRIPRNALPTQIQAGSYRAMLPSGTSTDATGGGLGTSTDASGCDGGATYQPLSSLTGEAEKLCEDVNNFSSPSSVSNAGKTCSNYDPLYRVIDKFCEEVYGISSGPRRNSETQNETSKQKESVRNNASQPAGPEGPSQSQVPTTSALPREQESLPNQTTSTVQNQPEAEIKIKQEPGLEDTQNEEEMRAVRQGQTPCERTVDTTREQVVSVQSQATFLSATQPTQNIVQSQAQVPSLVLVEQRVQTVGQDPISTYIPVQNQAQPLGMFTIQGSGQPQIVTQGQSHVTQPQLVQQQQQSQGQFRLQHLPQTPQFQGVVRAQQPRVLSPGQGQIPIRPNLQALRQNPQLTRLLHRHFPGMINRFSRKSASFQNVGINQQNVARPPGMIRPQIPNGEERNQAIPWNAQKMRQLFEKQGMKNPSTVYITPSNELQHSSNSAITALSQSANLQARQPTLEQAKRYYQVKSNISQARSNVVGPGTQQLLLAQRPNANLSRQPIQAANQGRILRPTTTQIQSGNANVSSPAHTFNGRSVVSRIIGPDLETAVANRINQDPTSRSTLSSVSTVNATCVESLANRSNVPTSSASGLNNPSSDMFVTDGVRSRSTTPHSNQPSPQPLRGSSLVDNQPQGLVQRRASVNNQSEQSLQGSGSDTNNPDESEDEGLGLNASSESDSVQDVLKDITGTKKVLEKLGHLVPKEDILQLLEKAKINHKEQIDKWTNEYEAAARCERHKYLEFENLREKIEREQENARKLCENIVKWKKEAEKVRTEKSEAAKKKREYQNKITEENEKIPVLNECINMFANQGVQ